MSEPGAVDSPSFLRRNMAALSLGGLLVVVLIATIGLWGWSVHQRAAEIDFLKSCDIRVETAIRDEGTLGYKLEELVLGDKPRGVIREVHGSSEELSPEQNARVWNVLRKKLALETMGVALSSDDAMLSELAAFPELKAVFLEGKSTATDAWLDALPPNNTWNFFCILAPRMTSAGFETLLDKSPNLTALSVPAHVCTLALMKRIAESNVAKLRIPVFTDHPVAKDFGGMFAELPRLTFIEIFGAGDDVNHAATLNLSGVTAQQLIIGHFQDVVIDAANSKILKLQSIQHFRGRNLSGELIMSDLVTMDVADSPNLTIGRIDLNTRCRSLIIQRCSCLSNIIIFFSPKVPCEFEFADLPSLETLRISSLSIRLATALKKVSSLKQLEILAFWCSERGALAELGALPNLEKLQIQCKDSTLPFLDEELAALPQLRQVEILGQNVQPPASFGLSSPKEVSKIELRVNELRELYPKIEFILK